MTVRDHTSRNSHFQLVVADNDPILDAIVIQGCKTCAGSGVRPKPYGDKRDDGRTFHACPDCPPPVVVEKAALDALAVAMVAAASGIDETGEEWEETMQGFWEESYDEAVERFRQRTPAILTALFSTPPLVAREVVTLGHMILTSLDGVEVQNKAGEARTIAILEDSHE